MENRQLSLFDLYEHPFISSIFNALPESESDEIEYKSAEGGFPDEFWKTYSAYANSKGGIIVLGVKERRNEFIFEGLAPNKIGTYKKAFWDNANNPQKVSINLLSDKDLIDIVFEGNHFLVFRIPAATRVQRPVFITSNPFGNTYKRNHEGDYKCTKEEVSRMIADADLNVQADSRILEGYTFDDFDSNSIRQYRQLFASNRPGHIWLSFDDKEFLTQLGAFRVDRKSKNEGVTLAGMLMFGKTNSIIDPECCPNFFPDYREMLSLNPEIRWTDRIYPDGNWEANLFQFYRIVWPKLASSLPKPFQLKDGVRQDETPAHIALREAFVNALIHTDYSAPNNIVIEQRIDNYRFSNPGTLLVSIKQYYHGGTSECRNTTLQKMFLMIGSAEKAGSGVNKIIYGWEYAQWRRPYLIIESQPDRLILDLPKFNILPEETLHSLRELFGEKVDALGKDELNILAICHIEGEVNNNRLQDSINKHRTDITKILQELCKEGFMLSENKSRWTTYHLNMEYGNDVKLDTKVGSSNQKVGTSKQKIGSSETLTPNLDTSAQKVGSSETSNPDIIDSKSDVYVAKKQVGSTKQKVDTFGSNVDTSASNVDTSSSNVDTSKQKVGSSETLTPNLDTSEQKVGSSETLNPNIIGSKSDVYVSKKQVGSTKQKVDTSKKKVDTFGSNVDTSDSNVDTSETLTPNLDTSKQKVDTSNNTKSKKLSKEQLNILIIKSCKTKYMTIEQIALTVNRSPGYLQNEVLPNLVSNAKLERLFPDNPNHPNQAYKAAKKIK